MAPPELIDDAVGEILLRLPPDDPAHLLRASVVCKPWRLLLTDPAFRRRYHAFHRAPPVLGFLRNTHGYVSFPRTTTTLFIPTASFRPRDSERRSCSVRDCRHGRVLLYDDIAGDFLVWDPITGEDQRIPNEIKILSSFNAAVLCAAADCDHLDCHGGPFLIVLVAVFYKDRAMGERWTRASVYSSEAGKWSAPTAVDSSYFIEGLPPVLAGDNNIYFICNFGEAMLRYDLREKQVFLLINARGPSMYNGVFIQAEDGGPSFAVLKDYKLNLWSLESVDPDGVTVWLQLGVIQLDKLLPSAHSMCSPSLIGFEKAPDSDIIFVTTITGVFMIELESHKIRKVYDKYCGGDGNRIFPYRSFLTPDCAVGRLSLPLQQDRR